MCCLVAFRTKHRVHQLLNDAKWYISLYPKSTINRSTPNLPSPSDHPMSKGYPHRALKGHFIGISVQFEWDGIIVSAFANQKEACCLGVIISNCIDSIDSFVWLSHFSRFQYDCYAAKAGIFSIGTREIITTASSSPNLSPFALPSMRGSGRRREWNGCNDAHEPRESIPPVPTVLTIVVGLRRRRMTSRQIEQTIDGVLRQYITG